MRRQDLAFITSMVDKGAVERLEHVAATPFKRLSYTDAVAILEDVVRTKKKKFQYPVRCLVSVRAHAPTSAQC